VGRVADVRNGGCTSLGGALRGVASAAILIAALTTGCSDDAGDDEQGRATVPDTSTTSTSSTTTSTLPVPTFEPLLADPTLTPEQQVEAAYLFSWEIYLDAVERGDDTFLPLAYADAALDVVQAEVARYVQNGERRTGDVSLHYTVNLVDSTHAAVLDAYDDQLVLVDARTGEEIPEERDDVESVLFDLELRDGTWKVTRLVGYTS
jgi:hypothetical protein